MKRTIRRKTIVQVCKLSSLNYFDFQDASPVQTNIDITRFNTRRESSEVPHRNCLSNLLYMTNLSPKLRYLARIIHHVVCDLKERLIIFCDWPTTLYLYELFLEILGINFVVIRATHKGSEREAAVARFNDPTETLDILLASMCTSSTSNARA